MFTLPLTHNSCQSLTSVADATEETLTVDVMEETSTADAQNLAVPPTVAALREGKRDKVESWKLWHRPRPHNRM